MTPREPDLTETELDSALDRLMAPAPSELLVHRVLAMAPKPAARPRRLQRYALAAVLLLAVALAALVDVSLSHEHSIAHLFSPADETRTQFLDIADQPAPIAPAGAISVASLPLE